MTKEQFTPITVTVMDNGLLVARNAGKRAKNESQLYYWIKKALREQGMDVIKKLMYLDGHLTDDHRYYIRDRRGRFAYVDDYYALRSLAQSYNDGLTITLRKADL